MKDTSVKRLSLVRFYDSDSKSWIRAIVARWSGRLDSHAKLLDVNGNTYRRWVDTLTVIDDPELFVKLYELQRSKEGREALKTGRLERRFRTVRGHTVVESFPEPIQPEGHGAPDPGQVPIRVVRGMSGELNKAATRVVCIGPTERQSMTRGADRALNRDPALRYRLPTGELLTDALRRLGMEVPTSTQIRQRAEAILEFSRAALAPTPHNEGRETEAKSDALTATRSSLRSAACRP